MARYKPEHKAGTRRKVVESALDHFRGAGIDSTSLDAVMKGLGMTVGGFYRHFGSKADLLAQTVGRGAEKSIAFIRSVPVPEDGEPWFEDVARRYLSCPHRDNIARGCALAALGPEIARADERVRAACEAGLRRLREAAHEHLGDRAPAELERFWALIALNMGGLVLSRMVANSATAEDVLRSCRDAVAALAREGRPPRASGAAASPGHSATRRAPR
jgi:AcrR family transcriptional regulator